ncbi:BAF_HP2_G0030100.mRNA.1.CDS.1 [Saccharomyces cerevisiae]|nr:BAF_HP2_G0030100.mRNA.1.CDS.1 [Saccharomyces cerevisiae]CAI6454841.1 BAF_HP2_G0030100.mRNA.1.CDS.1 [Saccharomyces cerevisiae]
MRSSGRSMSLCPVSPSHARMGVLFSPIINTRLSKQTKISPDLKSKHSITRGLPKSRLNSKSEPLTRQKKIGTISGHYKTLPGLRSNSIFDLLSR